MDLRITSFGICLLVSMLTMTVYEQLSDFNLQALQECPQGYFLYGQECHPHLGCNEVLEEVQVYDDVILTFWPSRMIKLANWKNKKLVKHHSLNNLNLVLEFKQHLSLFKEALHDQLIGYCDAPGHFVFITDYQKGCQQGPQVLLDRLQLCSSYAELLVSLHQKDIVLEFDDEKDFLEEVIISQDPWRIILDDVLLMKSSNSSLNNMDIWMTPEICNSFLLAKDKQLKNYLSQIHKQCRDKDPEKRPRAEQLLKIYKDVLHKLQLSPFQ